LLKVEVDRGPGLWRVEHASKQGESRESLLADVLIPKLEDVSWSAEGYKGPGAESRSSSLH